MATMRDIYHAWRAGARLHTDDIARLADAAGLAISKNRLRELGRSSDRATTITADELHALIYAWANEQRGAS